MIDCPVNDWFCPYFDNGGCYLKNAKMECDAFYTGEEAKDEDEDKEEEPEDKYTLDDLGSNWY